MSIEFDTKLQFADFNRGYAIAMFAMWGIGVDIPRLLVRYGKSYPQTINIHSISMLIIGLLTLMYVIAQIAMNLAEYGSSYSGLGSTEMAQFALSIVLACLVIIQFVLGFLVRVQMLKDSPKTSLFTIKTIHMIVGWLMTIIGKVISVLLVSARASDLLFRTWLFSLGAILAIWLVIYFVFRSQTRLVIFNCCYSNSQNKHEKYHNDIYQQLVEGKEKIVDYRSKGVRYVIIDNNMYYIDENFMHPGGEYIFSLLNGREINYYLKGAKAVSPNHPRHAHSKFVIKYLEHRLVGELQTEPLLSNQKYPSSEGVDWTIASTTKTNYPGTTLVRFSNDAGVVNQQYRVEQFGKYIMMGCITEEVLEKCERPYYICLSCGEYQRGMLDRLRNQYKMCYYNEGPEGEEPERIEAKNPTLTFFIKAYRQGEFSGYLLKAPKQRIFTISGPYGRGLGLKYDSKGYYMLIAGGIGIAAFADLFNYLLQKTLADLIGRKMGRSGLLQANPDDQDWSSLSQLRVMLVGTFTNSERFYLSTPIKELYYLNMKHGLKTFNMMLHYQNSEVQHQIRMVRENFNRDFFTTLMEQEQPDRVIYSGPTKLEQVLRKAEPDLKLKAPIYYM